MKIPLTWFRRVDMDTYYENSNVQLLKDMRMSTKSSKIQ